MGWIAYGKNNPCPICNSIKWCRSSEDGEVITCRDEREGIDRKAVKKVDARGEAYWVHGVKQSERKPAAKITINRIKKGSNELLNDVYNTFVYLLELSEDHRAELNKRGLSDKEINFRGYKSWPLQGRSKMYKMIAKEFSTDDLLSVPGFITKEGDTGAYNTISGAVGLIIPQRDINGSISGLKVRSDTEEKDERYSAISSYNYGGPGPEGLCHIPLIEEEISKKKIRVTEGELKADIATVLSGILTISVPGVDSWARCLPILKSMGTEELIISFDAPDLAEKPTVIKALKNFYENIYRDVE